jgi:antitoxin component HigA of HigAB toxin-antitoxin module
MSHRDDLIWALEWLDTLADRIPQDGSVKEFRADIVERRGERPEFGRIAQEVLG